LAVKIIVNGTERTMKENTLNIKHKVNERSIASFVLVSDTMDNVRITKRQQVRISEDNGSATIFAGFVDTVVEKNVGTGNKRYHQITCVDNHYLVDKRIFAGAYENTTIKDIVIDVVTQKLLEEGITYTDESIDGGWGVVVKVQTFNYKRCDQVFDKLAERSGCDWWIDKDKVLYFKKLGSQAVGKSVTEDIIQEGSLKTKNNAHLYRNRQFIKGGRSLTDERTENFKGDGEKQTFTVGFPIAKKPTISLNSVEIDGALIGIKGLDDDDGSKDWFWTSNSNELTQAMNGTKLTASDTIAVTYKGYFSTIIISQDTKEITVLKGEEGSSGIVEYVDNEPNLDDKSEIFEVANSKLNKYKATSNKITFNTTDSGFTVGEIVNVNIPSEGIVNDNDYLVESITVKENYPVTWYNISLVKGFIHKSWAKAFTSFNNDQVDELIDMDAVEMVILPAFYEKTWVQSDQLNLMRETYTNETLIVGSIDAYPMILFEERNTKIEIYDVNDLLLDSVVATQTIFGTGIQTTVFVVPTSMAVGEWKEIHVLGGANDDVLFQVISERRTKTNFDELQIQLTDIKGW
jgi:hypothetical protein